MSKVHNLSESMGLRCRGVLRASLVFWSGYMTLSGLLLIIVPVQLSSLFGFYAPEDNWIRLFGALAFIIGLGYVAILKTVFSKALMYWTIIARYFFASITVLSVFVGWFPLNILLVGGFDAINATWTLAGFLLRKDK